MNRREAAHHRLHALVEQVLAQLLEAGAGDGGEEVVACGGEAGEGAREGKAGRTRKQT